MTKEKALKLQAKKHLQNNWPAAVGATITVGIALMATIYTAMTICIYILKAFTADSRNLTEENTSLMLVIMLCTFILALSLTLPLIMGLVRFCYLLSKNSFCDYSQVFYYVSKGRYFRTIGITALLIFRHLWQALLSFLPAAICLLRAWSMSLEKSNVDFDTILWYYIGYALLFGGILFFYVITKQNFLAIYFYIENDILNTSEICALSQRATFRFQRDINNLIISLFPMMLLCILIIPAIFVIPYVLVTQATSAKWMIALSNKEAN